VENISTSYEAFRRSWFEAILGDDLLTVQQLIQTAETGRTLTPLVKELVGGVSGLLSTRTKRGLTGIHIAVQNGRLKIAVVLLRLGSHLDWKIDPPLKENVQEITASSSGHRLKMKTVLELAEEYDLRNVKFFKKNKKMKMFDTLLAIEENIQHRLNEQKEQEKKEEEERLEKEKEAIRTEKEGKGAQEKTKGEKTRSTRSVFKRKKGNTKKNEKGRKRSLSPKRGTRRKK
jgi:hypothetical protein